MNDSEIEATYDLVKKYYNEYLKKYGVQLPKLKDKKGNYTKDALVLVYLARFYPNTVVVTKKELTQFIRKYYPDVNDVQQARHLGAQKGWFISAGGRDNVHVKNKGEYKLISLEKPYPNFTHHREDNANASSWKKILKNLIIDVLPVVLKKEKSIFIGQIQLQNYKNHIKTQENL